MLKFSSKINFDTIWVKVVDTETKSQARVHIGRSGMKATFKATEEMKDQMRNISSNLFEKMKEKDGLTYAQKVEALKAEYSK